MKLLREQKRDLNMEKIIKCFFILGYLIFSVGFAGAHAKENFLTISDIHYNHLAQNATYGQDTGSVLMKNALTRIKEVIKLTHPKFMIYLGDLPAHYADSVDRRIDDRYVLQHLYAIAGNVPLFYVPGNNDALTGDYHSFSNAEGINVFSLDPHHGWPGVNARRSCISSFFSACLLSAPYHLKYGFYSAFPLGITRHLQLIILNSVIFSPYYQDDLAKPQKMIAKKELNWFRQQLQAAKTNKDKVIIIVHIPPGEDSYEHRTMWTNLFKVENGKTIQEVFFNLIVRYHTIITVILAAHTHFDSIRILYNKSGKYVGKVTFTPGITPQHGNNPGFKTYYYDPETYQIIYSTTYYNNPEANYWGNNQYQFNDIKISHMNKREIISLIDKQYGVFRSDYLPPQGWQAVDKSFFMRAQ